MDNVDVGGCLCTTTTVVGLSIRISGCGRRQSWTGGIGSIGGLGHERFNEVLVSTDIRPWCGTSMRSTLVPLESGLIGDVGSVVNGVAARAAPDFAVSMAHKEACDNNTDDCTEQETTKTRSNNYADRDAGIPGRNIRWINRIRIICCLLGSSGKARVRPTPSTVQGSISPRKTVCIGHTKEEGSCPRERDSPVQGAHVV